VKALTTLLILLLLPILSLQFSAVAGLNENEFMDVSVDTARKIATFECQNMYGIYPEFDCLTYYDSNEEPAVYVFVFNKSGRFKTKNQLLEHLESAYCDIREVVEIIRSDCKGCSLSLYEARSELRNCFKRIGLTDDFISIYVSATTSRSAIIEERNGLPESYTEKWKIDRNYEQKFHEKPEIHKYYYVDMHLIKVHTITTVRKIFDKIF